VAWRMLTRRRREEIEEIEEVEEAEEAEEAEEVWEGRTDRWPRTVEALTFFVRGLGWSGGGALRRSAMEEEFRRIFFRGASGEPKEGVSVSVSPR
jgi:hypothetical protein